VRFAFVPSQKEAFKETSKALARDKRERRGAGVSKGACGLIGRGDRRISGGRGAM